MKDKEKLRNCPRLKETEQTKHLKAVCYPGLDSGPEKGQNGNKVYRLDNGVVSLLIC